MLLYHLLTLCISMYLLYRGADWLVKQASKVAANLGIKPITLAMTIIAFGTSAPELTTAIMSSVQQKPDFIIGNIIGSNIANLALIVGMAALIRRLTVRTRTLRLEIPFVTAAALLTIVFSLDGGIQRDEGGGVFLWRFIFTSYFFLLS